MYLKFKSDDSNNGRGFNLTYKWVALHCGGQSLSSSGTIMSPNYPQVYDPSLNCEWNIATDQSHSIVFQFIDFDLDSTDNCTRDYVEIYDPIFNKTLWKGGCSQMPNQTIFKSERNQLIVRMVTDGSLNAKGFKANFSNSCGARIIANDSGEFQYRRITDNLDCVWTISAADPLKKVVVTFTYTSIFIETMDGCLSNVEVYDGDSISAPLKTSFCGMKTPPAIFSNGNSLTIKLNASSVSYQTEFDVSYEIMDNGETFYKKIATKFYKEFIAACGGTYTTSVHGEFGSPNFPASSPLDTYCIWNIRASIGNKISLTVKNLDIAS